MNQTKPSPQGGGDEPIDRAYWNTLEPEAQYRWINAVATIQDRLGSETERLKAEVSALRAALEKIESPPYGLGFNKLRGIARKVMIELYGERPRAALTQAGGRGSLGLSEGLAVFADPALGMPKPKGQADD